MKCSPENHHHLYKSPRYVPHRRHSHDERVQSGTCVGFDSGCTMRVGDPVRDKLAEALRAGQEGHTFC